jgi:hypothetical protein
MKLDLKREPSSGECTLGKLSINGVYYCYTLEDVVRTSKIKGITAVPEGTYEVTITWSGRFNRPMPLLLDVPNFAGVRIHTGNTALDTEGCIIVGLERGKNAIYKSKAAYGDLFEKLKKAINTNEPVSIAIHNAADGCEVAASILAVGAKA